MPSRPFLLPSSTQQNFVPVIVYRCCEERTARLVFRSSLSTLDVQWGIDSGCRPYLDEANVGGLLAEALTADVEAVLADQTGAVSADTAVEHKKIQSAIAFSHLVSLSFMCSGP